MSSVPVVNATVPEQEFLHEPGEWVRAADSRKAVAHIVITLEVGLDDRDGLEILGCARILVTEGPQELVLGPAPALHEVSVLGAAGAASEDGF